jgi:hypothetical protein
MLAALRQVATRQKESQRQPAEEAHHLVGGETFFTIRGITIHGLANRSIAVRGVSSCPGTQQLQALVTRQRLEILVVRRRIGMPACRNEHSTTSCHSEHRLEVIGSLRPVEHDQCQLASQRLACGVARGRPRVHAKGACDGRQRQPGLRLPIERMKKDTVWETCRGMAARR